jgi:hypothetical protein
MTRRTAIRIGAGLVAACALSFGPALASPAGRDVTALSPQTIAAVRVAAQHAFEARAATVPASPSAGPKRVTGVSLLLDAMQAGSGIGLGEIYGLAVSGFTTIVPTSSLPPQVVQAGFTVLAVPPKLFDEMKQPTAQGFASLRQSLAPLAAANPAANALLSILAARAIDLGTNGKALVGPFDAQFVEFGNFLLVMEEPA